MTSNEQCLSVRALYPGGVNSPVRAFRSVGGKPRFIERAAGRIWDAEGTAISTTSARGADDLGPHTLPCARDSGRVVARHFIRRTDRGEIEMPKR